VPLAGAVLLREALPAELFCGLRIGRVEQLGTIVRDEDGILNWR
jgi:hypothetical protein